jgi:Flp pilus assembly protein protease CpaA
MGFMQYFLYLSLIPFLWINYKIIISDVRTKIIPNRYLSYLLLMLPFYYIYGYLFIIDFSIFHILWQTFFAFIISFILYYFNIWAAWDAKYLLVLSLFLPNVGIITFLGNMGLVLVLTLVINFFYFYLYKYFKEKEYIRSITIEIKNDIIQRWLHYKQKWHIIFLLLRSITYFLIIFVSLKLLRIYLFDIWVQNNTIQKWFHWEAEVYYYLLFFILLLGIFFLAKKIFWIINTWLSKQTIIAPENIYFIAILFLFFILTSYIIYWYNNNPTKTSELLFRIFTLYLAFYIWMQLLMYTSKITFGHTQARYIPVNKLEKWDMIDKQNIALILWEQKILGAHGNEDGPLYPNPKKYFLDLENPLDKESIYQIQKYINIVNQHYSKYPEAGITQINWVQILQTIAFAHYIALWFIVSYIYDKEIIAWCIKTIFTYIYSYY